MPGVNARNKATGGIAAHLFITEGRDTKYTATVTVKNGTSTAVCGVGVTVYDPSGDRKSTRLNSSHQIISYAVFCLKKKKTPGTSFHGNSHVTHGSPVLELDAAHHGRSRTLHA